MANEDHLKELKKGVDAWNRWREDNSHVRPDLRAANLDNKDLSKANLSGADLAMAQFSMGGLEGANLSGA